MQLGPMVQEFDDLTLTVVGDDLYFRARSAATGAELWRTDGTQTGTVLIADIYTGPNGSNPGDLIPLESEHYFAANSAAGRELWKTDGTATGTVQVADLYPGSGNSRPNELTVVGDELYFRANTPTGGSELWKTDGTETGTVQVADIYPGSNHSQPYHLTVLGDELFFSATSPSGGRELWKTDGTATGTVQVADINPGTDSSDPTVLTNVSDSLYFAANNGQTDREPWILLPNTPPQADAGGPYTTGEGIPVLLDASGSTDAQCESLQFRWDFENDGVWDTGWSSEATATHTWYDAYAGSVKVEVTDQTATSTDTATVTVYSAEEQLQQLATTVIDSLGEQGLGNALTTKLDHAIDQLAMMHPHAAINQLNAFINHPATHVTDRDLIPDRNFSPGVP